jgi:hypothetical protein
MCVISLVSKYFQVLFAGRLLFMHLLMGKLGLSLGYVLITTTEQIQSFSCSLRQFMSMEYQADAEEIMGRRMCK